jgi:hypothetical protein
MSPAAPHMCGRHVWEHPTTIRTSILLGQQTPRGQSQAVLYTAVRHSLPELQHRR